MLSQTVTISPSISHMTGLGVPSETMPPSRVRCPLSDLLPIQPVKFSGVELLNRSQIISSTLSYFRLMLKRNCRTGRTRTIRAKALVVSSTRFGLWSLLPVLSKSNHAMLFSGRISSSEANYCICSSDSARSKIRKFLK